MDTFLLTAIGVLAVLCAASAGLLCYVWRKHLRMLGSGTLYKEIVSADDHM
jgi:hypothetical protein